MEPVLFPPDDTSFWFETLRVLGATAYGGADIGGGADHGAGHHRR